MHHSIVEVIVLPRTDLQRKTQNTNKHNANNNNNINNSNHDDTNDNMQSLGGS
jgi:hypothetical protein